MFFAIFIIYLNDINYFQDFEFLSFFADDFLVACAGSELDSVLLKIKLTLVNLKLQLNVLETKAMLLVTKYRISQVSSTKLKLHLGNEILNLYLRSNI